MRKLILVAFFFMSHAILGDALLKSHQLQGARRTRSAVDLGVNEHRKPTSNAADGGISTEHLGDIITTPPMATESSVYNESMLKLFAAMKGHYPEPFIDGLTARWHATPNERQCFNIFADHLHHADTNLERFRLFAKHLEELKLLPPVFQTRPLIAGHRGASGLIPENTAEAISAAFSMGAQMAECDVFLSKDNIFVLNHDPDTARTGDRKLIISEHNFLELQSVDVSFGKAAWKGLRISALSDVLKAVPEGRRLLIEIKTLPGEDCQRIATALAELLDSIPNSIARSVVISFDQKLIALFKKHRPQYESLLITAHKTADNEFVVRTMDDVKRLGHEAKAMGIDGVDLEFGPYLTKEMVMHLRKEGLKVGIWSYGSDDHARNWPQMLGLDLEFIGTNHPAEILKLL